MKNQVKEQINNFNVNISLSDLADKNLKLFELITKTLIFEGEENKKLSNNSKEALLEFLRDFFCFCSQKLNDFMEKLVIKKSIELAISYHNKQEEIHEKSEKINKGIMNKITNQILNNISLFKTIGINTGKNDIKYKEIMEKAINNICMEQNRKIDIVTILAEDKQVGKGITKYIATEYIKQITDSMIKSFMETFNNIDNYMVKRLGEHVNLMSKELIKQIKG